MTLDAPLVLIALWACLLVTFMVVRPALYTPGFWLLLGSATLSGGLHVLLSHRQSRRTRRETADCLGRMNALIHIHDYEDDGHLAECLDEAERRRIIEELERMPAGSRSLRRALTIVSPELADGDERQTNQ
jgi:hypothetical protein